MIPEDIRMFQVSYSSRGNHRVPLKHSQKASKSDRACKRARGEGEEEEKKREMGERDQGRDRKQASVSQEGKLHRSSDG